VIKHTGQPLCLHNVSSELPWACTEMHTLSQGGLDTGSQVAVIIAISLNLYKVCLILFWALPNTKCSIWISETTALTTNPVFYSIHCTEIFHSGHEPCNSISNEAKSLAITISLSKWDFPGTLSFTPNLVKIVDTVQYKSKSLQGLKVIIQKLFAKGVWYQTHENFCSSAIGIKWGKDLIC
jgi:hypothetical protein